MAKIIGYRRGTHQHWPVYDRVPYENPQHVGGVCPPYAPLTRVAGGYACVEAGPRMQLVGFGADTTTAPVDASTVAPSTAPVKGIPGIPGLGPLFSDADIQHYAAVAVDVAWPAIETKLDAKIDEYKKPLYVAAAVSAAAYVFLLSLIMRHR